MSKDGDRNQVFQTTRVRTALKNDVSWIQKSKQENEDKDNARMDHAVETRPVVIRQKSYVLSTAKKFESVDSPLGPPLQKPHFIPPKGDSANKANGEVIPPQKGAQPQGSRVETTEDTKPQAPTEELIQNSEAQPEKSVAKTTAENADTAIYQSNVEHNKGAAEISVDVHAEESIQNGEAQSFLSTKENPEAVSLVELAEQPVASITAENKGEYADTAVDQSNVEHNEAKASADSHVEDPVAETSAAAGTEESQNTAQVPAMLSVELKPQEEPSTKTEPANSTNVEDAGTEPIVQPADGSSVEQAAEETVAAEAKVAVESSPDKSAVINATPGEETALQGCLEPVPGLLAESVSTSPPQPAAETTTEGRCEKGPPEQTAETVAAVAEVAMESSPETPAVTDAAGEECVEPVRDIVADTVTKSPTQPAAETAVKSVECKVESAASAEPVLKTRAEDVVECEAQPVDNTVVKQSVELKPESAADRGVELNIKDDVEPVAVKVPAALAVELKAQEEPSTKTEPANATNVEDAGTEPIVQPAEESSVEQAAEDIVEAVAEVAVESSPEKSDVINATPGEEAALQGSLEPVPGLLAESVSTSPPQPAAETATEGRCERDPTEQAAEETVIAVAEVAVESSPDKSAVINATPGEETALQGSLEPVPGLLAESVSKSPPQPAAETTTEGCCEKGPPEQAAETVAAVAEVAVESSPETPAVTDAAGEECVEPVRDIVADTVTKSPTQPAAETAVKSVECKVESAASAEPVLKTKAEEIVECEIQPVDNTVVKQSIGPTSESAADCVGELNIEDAVEPVGVQDNLAYRAIELTDALDVEPPTAVTAPAPHAEQTKLNQQSDDTNTSDMFQKPVEKPQSTQTLNKTRYGKTVCSFCDKIIDGNAKITFSEPLVNCHPDCLKCGVCGKALGNMLTSMFLHNGVIQCDGCFKKALNT